MAYFTAVLARSAGAWQARDLEVDGIEDLGEAAELLRAVALADDEPVVLLVEREDAWFAVLRVDGDEDPRVFVSAAEEARESPYAGLLGMDADSEEEGPVGDLDILADLGTPPEELAELAGEDGPSVEEAVSRLATAAGFASLLDELR